MKTFRKGGLHPQQNKFTAGAPIIDLPAPPLIGLMMSQSIGTPSHPIVKVGDIVSEGQEIAESAGFVSASIHSPVNGVIKKIEAARTIQGLWQETVIIEPDAATPFNENVSKRDRKEIDNMSADNIIKIVANAGIVGLGGATFPTRVKLTIPSGKKANTVILNGAECEPYLTCDDILMRTEAEKIILGAIIIKKAVDAENILIGIESNKPDSIKIMKEASKQYPFIKVITTKTKYPQGSEKQLIYALTGKRVPAGGLPIETGCVVDNVATAYAIYEAVYHSKPLIERLVTIAGPSVSKPGNYRVRIGTPLTFLLEQAGGVPQDTGKIISGGPMMGRAISTLDSYSTKGMSGIVLLPETMAYRRKAEPCIRCASCVSACPMGLEPYLFMLQAENSLWNDMAAHGVMNCLECGCCSYTCPSSRPLVDNIKLGKMELRKKK